MLLEAWCDHGLIPSASYCEIHQFRLSEQYTCFVEAAPISESREEPVNNFKGTPLLLSVSVLTRKFDARCSWVRGGHILKLCWRGEMTVQSISSHCTIVRIYA